jgi:spore coat polysaccharide biosynthesis predicted glycosyltransferase SpsG
LYKEPSWGKEKTDDYYNQWNNLVNGQLNQSDYIDLFLTSDAMILDSGSFLNEYLCVNKPSLYIMRDENLTNRFNEFGKAAFNFHYHGHDIKDITDFIKSTVIEGNDTLKDARENFIKTYLRPPGNNSASANIYAFIVNKVIG